MHKDNELICLRIIKVYTLRYSNYIWHVSQVTWFLFKRPRKSEICVVLVRGEYDLWLRRLLAVIGVFYRRLSTAIGVFYPWIQLENFDFQSGDFARLRPKSIGVWSKFFSNGSWRSENSDLPNWNIASSNWCLNKLWYFRQMFG